jgi:hypothetical protein
MAGRRAAAVNADPGVPPDVDPAAGALMKRYEATKRYVVATK